ncbi:MAG TPA: hypothetical protein VIN08_08195 [Ohtaekwangia sp.]|uniref:hypothetical protein n=1 Tax=Ohtaekwangia sp. TaxID=2066019 RepID=UPI002F95BC1D
MSTKPVFENTRCEIALHNDHTIGIRLKGFLKITELTEISNFMKSFLKTHTITDMLIDQSEVKVLSSDVLKYMTGMVATIAQNRIQRIAIIDAEDIFAKASFSKLDKEAAPNNTATLAHFMHARGAWEWLQINSTGTAL